jgi:leader peptidase (prepilin peptidase)/N-methyltransferase
VLIAIASTLDPEVGLVTGVALALLVPPALIDVIDRRLPNRLVLRAGVGASVVGLISIVAGGRDTPWLGLVGSLANGSVALAGPLLAMHLISPQAMGLGDVKAAIVAGAALGAVDPALALVALAIASASGAIAGVVRQRSTIAFGPALVGGSIAAVVLHAGSALGAVQ